MLFFRWLFRSSRTAHSNFAVTQQMDPAAHETSLPEYGGAKGNRKEKSRVCRDQLYEVVREAMTRSGVLSASYKFKVFSPDGPAGSYLVMIDLSSVAIGSAFRPADTEAQIVLRAMKRYAIAVSAVYWRLHAASSICKIPDFPAGQTSDFTKLAQPEKFTASQLATATTSVTADKPFATKRGRRRHAPGRPHDFEETEAISSVS